MEFSDFLHTLSSVEKIERRRNDHTGFSPLDDIVRIQSLEFKNLKGVKNGKIELFPIVKNGKQAMPSNILALYGQNGSGKTTVIQLLYLLKLILSGKELPDDTRKWISHDSDSAFIKVVFTLHRETSDIIEYITYSFSLKKMQYLDESNTETVGISDEVLSVCKRDYAGKLVEKTHRLFDSNSKNEVLKAEMLEFYLHDVVINPDKKWKVRTPYYEVLDEELGFRPAHSSFQSRQAAIDSGKSVIFSRALDCVNDLDYVKNGFIYYYQAYHENCDLPEEYDTVYAVEPNRYSYVGLLAEYADRFLFVAGGNLFNAFSKDSTPIFLRNGYFQVHQEDQFSFNQFIYLKWCLQPFNKVLSTIIPGLKLAPKMDGIDEQKAKKKSKKNEKKIKDWWSKAQENLPRELSNDKSFLSFYKLFSESVDETTKDFLITTDANEPFFNFSFYTQRGNTVTPLLEESEGIKHIIYALDLVIAAYNNPSMTVAIDELDAGVFEYLLGEILKVFEQHGKGQLIFTSHNLRPLEVLDRSFVCFTTSNPENRYIRMKYLSQTNNLRDVYYRQILVGEQSEDLYDYVDSFDLKEALDKAGEL